MREFAVIWQAADKIVYSKTLAHVSSARTRIAREFEPETVRHLKGTAERDLSVAGPNLAAQPCRPAWSMSATCSSRRSSWEVGRRYSRTTSASSSTCRTSGDSATASSTFATARAPDA